MDRLNFQGLRKRTNFDSIIHYLQNDQEKIIYPDRTATNILSQLQSNFSDFYNTEKEMKNQKIIKMLMLDKNTQTDFLQNSGVTININSFREDYHERLNSGDYYLSGGSSNDYKTIDKTIKEKAIQTMDLKRNRSKYITEKIQKLVPELFNALPSLSSFASVAEPIPEYQFGISDILLGVSDPILNTLFDPFGHVPTPPISVVSSPPISVASSHPISIASSHPISVASSPNPTIISIPSVSSDRSLFPSPSPISSRSSSSSSSRRSRKSKN